ncbi:hypothetical protein GGR56DRAFT_681525 [Xylariaceae sp. FL0804]|nr:hypothetical protein GGR56DRAFT_681525 [Xylariaceae sp. FL0804]
MADEKNTYPDALGHGAITCVETHTVGMPARIITGGFPPLGGTLLEQKDEAAARHDAVRQRVLLEPRGHADMFGAALRPHTELTGPTGAAHMGVLYFHGGGYSRMCGHATLAVCRVLVDTHDPAVFPQRRRVRYDPATGTSTVVLHTLSGPVRASVPAMPPDGRRSDPSRRVSFVAPPCFALATRLAVDVPPAYRWPELGARGRLEVSLAYCSAFTCQVELGELGFPPAAFHSSSSGGKGEGEGSSLSPPPWENLRHAAMQLKRVLNETAGYAEKHLRHPATGERGACFGVMIAAKGLGRRSEHAQGVETGLFVFGDGTIDRSPTGSVAAARNAVAFAEGLLGDGETWSYQCPLSNTFAENNGLDARVLRGEGRREVEGCGFAAGPVQVEVQGFPYYTGFHTFVMEKEDPLGDRGFTLDRLGAAA